MRTVHPRACGESVGIGISSVRGGGSSPRMRGKLFLFRWIDRVRRFIPAHAGKAFPLFSCVIWLSVHPRACGESMDADKVPMDDAGSSPRMRGKLPSMRSASLRPRFIPAHAGKAWCFRAAQHHTSVHPRACGESPPIPSNRLPSVRFIPAHAGKAAGATGDAASVPVHPRACGESLDELHKVLEFLGSSPRMRGKPQKRKADK